MALYEILEDGTIRKVAGGLKNYTAGNGISIENSIISSNVPHFFTAFDSTSEYTVTGGAITLKSYTVNLPKGKYMSYISGVIKTSNYTVDLYPVIDGVTAGPASTNLTTYAGVCGCGTFNLEDGDHTINFLLYSRATATMPSYTRTTFFLIRVGD